MNVKSSDAPKRNITSDSYYKNLFADDDENADEVEDDNAEVEEGNVEEVTVANEVQNMISESDDENEYEEYGDEDDNGLKNPKHRNEWDSNEMKSTDLNT